MSAQTATDLAHLPVEPSLADMALQMEELQKKVAGLKPGPQNKLAMVVFSGDMDKLLASMIIASGAAAMGMEVVLFFTFWATAALRDPESHPKGKDFMSRMFGWMLPKGRNEVKLSQMNMGGMGTSMLKSLMKKKNAPTLDQLFEICADLGVKIKVCEMSMDLMGFKREELIDYPDMEFVGVATFLAHARNAANQLFI
ncbi:MAG: DsrE/DsrF/DrsH-like family protein [Deltaproteobacteria bacterium]|nr:DsrE/DsrF/DrsH-like family protein [Deltaproteobacteria bacterium]